MVLNADVDYIGTHFMFVGSGAEGGKIPFDVPTYLVQAANLAYLTKNLCFEKFPNEDFQCLLHTTKPRASDTTTEHLQFNFGIQLLFGEKGTTMPLGIDQQLQEREAVSLMVTFDKDQIESSSLGCVVLSEPGSVFEVEEVSSAETNLYQGFAAFSELSTQLMEQIKDLSEVDIERVAEAEISTSDFRLEEEIREIIMAARMIKPPLDILRKELNSAGVQHFLAKQDVLVQIGIPANLLDICLILCSMMRNRWKVKPRVLLSLSTITRAKPVQNSSEDKADSFDTFGAFSSSEESGSETVTDSDAQKTEQESDEEDQYRERNSLNEQMKELSRTARPFFDQSLEILFDCLKGNQENCKAFIRFDQKLLEIFEFNRQLVGSILAELYAYAFPSVDNLNAYYSGLLVHFSNITHENIIDQHLFTRIIRRLMDGGTYESDLFRDYCYQLMSARETDIMSYKLAKSEKRLWITFELIKPAQGPYTYDDQIRNNPILADIDRKEIDHRVYFAMDQITDVEYIEYIRQCMVYSCIFQEDSIGENLLKWNDVTSLLLVDAIYMGNVPAAVKNGALSMLDRLLSLYRPRKSRYILQFSDIQGSSASPNDLVRLHREALEWPHSRKETALQDLRQAARLSLYLGASTKTVPLTGNNLPLVEKIRLARGLFRLCLRLIKDGFATKEYLRFALGVVKVAFAQLGKHHSDSSNWFSDILKSAISQSNKDFEVRGDVEQLYDTVFQVLMACIREATAWHFDHFMDILRTPHSEYKGGKGIVWGEVIQRVTGEIVAPLEAFLWEKETNVAVTRRTLSRVAVSPLPSAELFDKETFYSLSEFSFRVNIPMLELLDSLFIDSVSFGINFERKLISTLLQTVNLRLTVGLELEKLIVIDEKAADLLGPAYNCKLQFKPETVTAMTFGSVDRRVEGVEQVTKTFQAHPFLSAAEALSSREALRLLQMLTALYMQDGDFFSYFFQQLREIEAEGLNSAQKIGIYSARAAVMKFLWIFIKDNERGKKLVGKWLKPGDIAFLIPEVAEFALEYGDFDYLSTKEMQLSFASLQHNLRHPDYWTAQISYIFAQVLIEDSEIEAQNLVVCAIGEDVKAPLKQLVKNEQISEENLRFVELAILTLSDCSRINSIARKQVVKLMDAKTVHHLVTSHKGNFRLLLALVTFLDTVYRKDIERAVFPCIQELLSIALEVLSQPQELLQVIGKNVYGEVPHMRETQHSGMLQQNFPEGQRNTLAKLRFLTYRSSRHEYGVLEAVPNVLRRLAKYKKVTGSELESCEKDLSAINLLMSRMDEEDFDFRHFHFHALKSVQIVRKLITENMLKKNKAPNQLTVQASSSVFHNTFTEKLLDLYPQLITSLHSTRLVKSLASRISGMLQDPAKGKAEEALLILYRKRPLFPLKTFAKVIVQLCKLVKSRGGSERLFKLMARSPMLLGLFFHLGVSSNIRTNIAILRAINGLLFHQSPISIEKLKNALYERSLDADLLLFMQQELKQGFETYRSWILGEPTPLYISSLSYFKYQTHAVEERRVALIRMQQQLVVQLMTLMQRFCDNCNLPMQNYARKQSEKTSFNVNLVELVTDFLFSICVTTPDKDILRAETLEYVTAAAATLIEFATGPCQENQTMIGSSIPLYLSLNKLLQLPPNEYYQLSGFHPAVEDEEEDPVTTLRATVTKLLATLLEGDPDPQVITLIDRYLDKRLFVEHAKRMYVAFQPIVRSVEAQTATARLATMKVTTVLEEVCFLIAFLQKCENKPLDSVLISEEDKIPYRQFYLNYVGYVEIDMEPEVQGSEKTKMQIRDVFFVIPFKTKFLPMDSALEVITEVNRDSVQAKKESFLRSVEMRKREMEHHQRIAHLVYLPHFFRNAYYLKLVSFVLVFIINIALFGYDDQSMMRGEGFSSGGQAFVMVVLGVIQLICYCVGAALQCANSYTKIVDRYKAEDEGMKFERLAFLEDRESQRIIYLDEIELSERVKEANEATIHWRMRGFGVECRALLLYNKNLAALGYLAVSVISISYPMAYPLTLLQIFDHVSQLVVVLQAITYNGFQLIVTALFGLLLLLLFAVGSFVWFADYFLGDNAPNLIYCDALWDCLTSTIVWGLLSGGGLGDAMGTANKGSYWGRLTFDIVFFLIINVIMLNIIFGIIIDTFGELRDKRNAVIDDINSRCFICGLDRNEIEQHGKGWPYHFQIEHSPYACLAFFIYLTDKPLADCSGVEKYAKLKLALTNIGFLPNTSRLMAKETR